VYANMTSQIAELRRIRTSDEFGAPTQRAQLVAYGLVADSPSPTLLKLYHNR
jgi:hypothetical protein